MEQIEIGGITFCVIRSNRRTACIRVNKEGIPEILCPRGTDRKTLCRLTEPYCDRIRSQISCVSEQLESRRAFSLGYGDRVRYLGGYRTVEAGRAGYVNIEGDSFRIPPGLDEYNIRNAVTQAYKLAAKNYLNERVRVLAPRLGQTVNAVKVNSATSHWASASARQTLNFSWFCIMAEPEAVDYIIIHELCHFTEFNHSPRFWAIVERYCPDYRRHKEYLKKLWTEIESENWK